MATYIITEDAWAVTGTVLRQEEHNGDTWLYVDLSGVPLPPTVPELPEFGSSEAVKWENGVKEFILQHYRRALEPLPDVMEAWRSAKAKPLSEAAKVALNPTDGETPTEVSVGPENRFWSASDTLQPRTEKQAGFMQSLLRSKQVPSDAMLDIAELVKAQKTGVTKKQAQSIISMLVDLPYKRKDSR